MLVNNMKTTCVISDLNICLKNIESLTCLEKCFLFMTDSVASVKKSSPQNDIGINPSLSYVTGTICYGTTKYFQFCSESYYKTMIVIFIMEGAQILIREYWGRNMIGERELRKEKGEGLCE